LEREVRNMKKKDSKDKERNDECGSTKCEAKVASGKKGSVPIPYRKGEKWGFCNRERKIVVSTVYDSALPFSEGFAPVNLKKRWGFIDTKGNLAVPAIYDGAGFFSDGLAPVELNGKWGFIDTKGNMAIPAVYDHARFFSEGLARVKLNGKWGFIDTKGTQYWEDGLEFVA